MNSFQYAVQFSKFIMSSKLHQVRDCYRRRLRRVEICKCRQQIRKILLSPSESRMRQCSICLNMSLTIQPLETTAQVLNEVFNKQFVCNNHMEILLTKALAIVSAYPQTLLQFIYKDSEEEMQLYARKVVLVLEVISNELLISNQQIQHEVQILFSDMQGFGQKLFDCAYGLNNTSFYQEQSTALTRNADIKRISFNTLLLIFFRYPLLIAEFFDQYPLVWMIRQCNENRLLQIYEVLYQIFKISEEAQNYAKLCTAAQECLKQHIEASKTLKYALQVQQKLIWLIDGFSQLKPFANPETVFEIFSFCKNKNPNLIKKITRKLLELSQNHKSLKQHQRQRLIIILKIAQQFYDSDFQTEMEIQEL